MFFAGEMFLCIEREELETYLWALIWGDVVRLPVAVHSMTEHLTAHVTERSRISVGKVTDDAANRCFATEATCQVAGGFARCSLFFHGEVNKWGDDKVAVLTKHMKKMFRLEEHAVRKRQVHVRVRTGKDVQERNTKERCEGFGC